MSLSKNIRQFRKDHGIAQEYMADKLCMSQPTYHRLEQREIACAKRLPQIAYALKTTPETLLTYHLVRANRNETDQTDLTDALKTVLAEKEALIQKQSNELIQLRQEIRYLQKPT